MSRVHGTDRMRDCQYCGQLFRAILVKGKRALYCSGDCKDKAIALETPPAPVIDPAAFFERPTEGRLIELSQGAWAIVDEEDYERVAQYKWSLAKGKGSKFYAQRNVRDDGQNTSIKLHNFIVGPDSNVIVRHINKNGLDNRRVNFRTRPISVERSCKNCGKIFLSKIRSTGEYSAFCSRPCWDAYAKTWGKDVKEAKCLSCGEVRQLRSNRLFCSPDCKKVFFKDVDPIQCSACGKTKDAWEFACSNSWATGVKLKSTCTKCMSLKWNSKRTRDTQLRNNLMYFYGMTKEWYDETMAAQNGRCALCGEEFAESEGRKGKGEGKGLRACIDHSHANGHIRGIIHATCNMGLGRFGDSIEKLTKAIDYLKKYGE